MIANNVTINLHVTRDKSDYECWKIYAKNKFGKIVHRFLPRDMAYIKQKATHYKAFAESIVTDDEKPVTLHAYPRKYGAQFDYND